MKRVHPFCVRSDGRVGRSGCAGALKQQFRSRLRIATLSEASPRHVDGVRPGAGPGGSERAGPKPRPADAGEITRSLLSSPPSFSGRGGHIPVLLHGPLDPKRPRFGGEDGSQRPVRGHCLRGRRKPADQNAPSSTLAPANAYVSIPVSESVSEGLGSSPRIIGPRVRSDNQAPVVPRRLVHLGTRQRITIGLRPGVPHLLLDHHNRLNPSE